MRILMRILLTVLIIGLIGFILAVYVINQSRPLTEGMVTLPEMNKQASVYYDSFGIPHIQAESRADAYRALGFVHAQDRIFQMEMMRRVGHGRLSELFGKDLVKTDAFFRTLGTHRYAAREASRFYAYSIEVQEVVNAYLEGVNAFIARDRLPLEFILLSVKPEPFTTADIAAISAYMAYSFAYALRTDPVAEHIYTQLDSTYWEALDWGYWAPGLASSTEDSLGGNSLVLDMSRPSTEGCKNDFGRLEPLAFFDILPVPTLQGSNAWAIGPNRSATGHAMLSNDTHIKYGAPSAWYEAHLQYPGYELYGNFLGGIPFALIGHTRGHSWGLTMFEDDDSDFFVEQWAEDDSSATVFGESQTKPVQKFTERIVVKGAPDTAFTVYETENGVLINHFLPVEKKEPVSLYWNFTCIEQNLHEAFYALNTAMDMHSFRDAAAQLGSPGLNITYADTSGNIASYACSRLIRRPPHAMGKAFLRGYAPEDAYLGFYDFDRNPQVENPASGMIVSANQHHHASEGVSYPGYYAPFNRYDRIGSMIKSTPSASLEDMKRWITDVRSEVHEQLCHEVAELLLKSGHPFSDMEKEGLEQLQKWDGEHKLETLGPALYYATLYHIVDAAMRDELGDALFEVFLTSHLFSRSFPKLIQSADTPWWQSPTHPDRSREEVLVMAFQQAVKALSAKWPKPAEWKWDKVHSTEFEHPMGKVEVLKPYLSRGPYPSPGGHETVNNAGFYFNANLTNKAHYGPAMRILIDMGEVNAAESILPLGNSGNPASPHYDDQMQMYLKGEFRPMLMNWEEIKASSRVLQLTSQH